MQNLINKINLDKVLGIDYYYSKDIKNNKLFALCLLCFIKSLFLKDNIKNGSNFNNNYLFLKTQNRRDYDNLFNIIYNSCNQNKGEINLKYKYSMNFLYIYYFVKLSYVRKTLQSTKRLLVGLYLYLKFVRYFQVIVKLDKIQFCKLVVFSDVQPIENLFVQICNLRERDTITLQHGLFIDYKNLPNINMLNYTNVSSQTILVWGENSKNLFLKYNPKINVVICGNPAILPIQRSNTLTQYFGVVFDQPLFLSYNKLLLDIAQEFAKKKDLKIKLRIHPQDDINNYDIQNEIVSVNRDVYDVDFVLAHTTTMIFELLTQGIPVYKLDTDIPSHKMNQQITFRTYQELENKFNSNFSFKKEADEYIKFINKESYNRYTDFFNKLMKL